MQFSPPTSTPDSSRQPVVAKLDAKAVVKEYALELGFDLVRVTSAQEFAQDRKVTLERLRAGLMDGLPWFTESRVERGSDPSALLPEARSVICLGLNYYQQADDATRDQRPAGRVAVYAWDTDYHKAMKRMMRSYVDGLRARLGREFAARWYVDDGPMLDRAAANRAGLGWFGKNTNLLTPSHGSWVFLGQVVTGLELEPDSPLKKTCGSCVRCIEQCPTAAITEPYTIDNTRCISYLTIENRGEIPLDLRPQMGDWVFGCDICQEVCPVNRKASPSSPRRQGDSLSHDGDTTAQSPGQHYLDAPAALDLIQVLEMSDEEFKRRFPRDRHSSGQESRLAAQRLRRSGQPEGCRRRPRSMPGPGQRGSPGAGARGVGPGKNRGSPGAKGPGNRLGARDRPVGATRTGRRHGLHTRSGCAQRPDGRLSARLTVTNAGGDGTTLTRAVGCRSLYFD